MPTWSDLMLTRRQWLFQIPRRLPRAVHAIAHEAKEDLRAAMGKRRDSFLKCCRGIVPPRSGRAWLDWSG